MRFREIAGGLSVPVSNEEQQLIEKIEEEGTLAKNKLEEREQEVARKLVSRGVLIRRENDEGKIAFEPNSLQSIWRI